MIVKHLTDVIGTEAEIDTPTWTSRRLLLKKDGLGYSVHDTIIKQGTETIMEYRNHLEAVYLIEGKGEIETLADGRVYPLTVGSIYALDKHDKHVLRANKGSHMRMVCVFNPPVTGEEVHDETGAYPLPEDSDIKIAS